MRDGARQKTRWAPAASTNATHVTPLSATDASYTCTPPGGSPTPARSGPALAAQLKPVRFHVSIVDVLAAAEPKMKAVLPSGDAAAAWPTPAAGSPNQLGYGRPATVDVIEPDSVYAGALPGASTAPEPHDSTNAAGGYAGCDVADAATDGVTEPDTDGDAVAAPDADGDGDAAADAAEEAAADATGEDAEEDVEDGAGDGDGGTDVDPDGDAEAPAGELDTDCDGDRDAADDETDGDTVTVAQLPA